MPRPFQRFKSKLPDGIEVMPHIMPTQFVEDDGLVCADFENLDDAVGFPPDVLNPDIELDRVVLALALICNDMLDAVWVSEQMRRGRSNATTPTPYEGARTGRSGWATRVLSSITHEALQTLEEHASLLQSDSEVLKTLATVAPETLTAWNDLLELAQASGKEPLRHFFLRVRNKLSYHYADAKELARGYRRVFLESERTAANRLAYISSGKRFSGVRFYFADAAVQAATQAAMERASDDPAQSLTKVALMTVSGIHGFVLKFMEMRVKQRLGAAD